jgi:hypothetical protein
MSPSCTTGSWTPCRRSAQISSGSRSPGLMASVGDDETAMLLYDNETVPVPSATVRGDLCSGQAVRR